MTEKNSELEKVINGCLNNDRLSQKQLYEMYAPRMFVVCRRYANSTAEAEDMLLEGFMNVFKNLQTFKGDSSLSSWIYSIMVYSSISHYRSHRRYQQEQLQEDMDLELSETNEEAILSKVSANQIVGMFELMPETPRIVFNLKEIEGYSFTEIAKMLGKKEGAIRIAHMRARQWLRSHLGTV